jgi:hypothetical protein
MHLVCLLRTWNTGGLTTRSLAGLTVTTEELQPMNGHLSFSEYFVCVCVCVCVCVNVCCREKYYIAYQEDD